MMNCCLKIIEDRIRFWEIERSNIRISQNKNFLTSKEGDIQICNVVMEELKGLLKRIKGSTEQEKINIEDMKFYKKGKRLDNLLNTEDKKFGCGKVLQTYHYGTLNCGDFQGEVLCNKCKKFAKGLDGGKK